MDRSKPVGCSTRGTAQHHHPDLWNVPLSCPVPLIMSSSFPPATLLFIASIHTQLRMATHILFESASGYAIFEVKLRDELASMTEAVQKSIQDLGKFKKMVTLLSFSPFKNAAHALENANDVSEGA